MSSLSKSITPTSLSLLTRRTPSSFSRPAQSSPALLSALALASVTGRYAPNHKKTDPAKYFHLGPASFEVLTKASAGGLCYETTFRQEMRRKVLALDTPALHSLTADSYKELEAASAVVAASKCHKWSKVSSYLIVTCSLPSSPSSFSPSTPSDPSQQLPLAHRLSCSLSLPPSSNPFLLHPLFDAPPLSPPLTMRPLEDYAACACSVQNVLLSLHSEGFSAKWSTGDVCRTPAFLQMLEKGGGGATGGGDELLVVAMLMVKEAGGGESGGERDDGGEERRRSAEPFAKQCKDLNIALATELRLPQRRRPHEEVYFDLP